MSGAAISAMTLYSLAKNNVTGNFVAVCPLVLNLCDTYGQRPDDVVVSYSGKSVEIDNTDAEGRLILADAITYAVRDLKASRIFDIATLTGSVVNMLGFSIAGVLCDDDKLYKRFENAFEKSGEQYHRLPFEKEHEEMIKSEVADVKNIGGSCCGTITAGLFIRKFAEQIPWIHLDIAGTAWVDTPLWKYQQTGATGAGVSTIYHLCETE